MSAIKTDSGQSQLPAICRSIACFGSRVIENPVGIL